MKPDASKNSTQASPEPTGKRSAVGLNSGSAVAHSVPVLRQPTPPLRAGRKPAACPPPLSEKSGRGLGRSPKELCGREAPPESFLLLPTAEIALLIEFFTLLDTWEGRSHEPQVM